MGLGKDEWDNLAWWVRRTYLDGFEAEGLVNSGGSSAGTPRRSVPDESSAADSVQTTIADLSNAPIGTFASQGFRERTIDPSGMVRRVGRPRA